MFNKVTSLVGSLRANLAGLIAGKKTIAEELASLSKEDRTAFDALPLADKARVIVGNDGGDFRNTKLKVAELELQKLEASTAVSATKPAAAKPAPFTLPPSNPVATVAAVAPPVAQVKPAAAVPVAQPQPPKPQMATEQAIKTPLPPPSTGPETTRANEIALCNHVIAFNELQSQDSRDAYWLIHYESIFKLIGSDHYWLGKFAHKVSTNAMRETQNRRIAAEQAKITRK